MICYHSRRIHTFNIEKGDCKIVEANKGKDWIEIESSKATNPGRDDTKCKESCIANPKCTGYWLN